MRERWQMCGEVFLLIFLYFTEGLSPSNARILSDFSQNIFCHAPPTSREIVSVDYSKNG